MAEEAPAIVTQSPMPEPAPPDAGQELMGRLVAAMQVDEAWSVHSTRSLTWWGHRLAQQIWVDPPREQDGRQTVRVHAATDLLHGVPPGPQTAERLSTLNRFCTLSTIVWEAQSGEVALHAAVTLDAENASWLEPLFATAITLQAAEAHASVDEWARLLEGTVAVSEHPTSGRRKLPDERLDVVANVFAKLGSDVSPFTGEDFAATLRMEPAPWTRASELGQGLTAELPFWQDDVHDSKMATITASADSRHPSLGYGALVRLALPMQQGEGASLLATRLNAAEVREGVTIQTLGAWCKGPDEGVSFLTFLPAAAYEPGILRLMVMNAVERARWVRETLTRSEEEQVVVPGPMPEAAAS